MTPGRWPGGRVRHVALLRRAHPCLLGHLEALYAPAVRSPTHTLAELEILIAAERSARRFCRTEGSAPRDRSVHHVIAARGWLESERVALVHARTGETIRPTACSMSPPSDCPTLREAGVGAESPVPLFRRAWLRHGHRDPRGVEGRWFYSRSTCGDPKARLRSTIEESGASVVLADSDARGRGDPHRDARGVGERGARPRPRLRARPRARRARPASARVHHLHLGLHGSPQGRDGGAPRHDEPPPRQAPRSGLGRGSVIAQTQRTPSTSRCGSSSPRSSSPGGR